jgi:signal transduction histidine kinase
VSSESNKSKTDSVESKYGEETLYAYCSIEDTCPGLTLGGTTRLFKRFSQATSKTQIAYGGSGLGLHVCKELIEKQGGGIGVASKRGEGS